MRWALIALCFTLQTLGGVAPALGDASHLTGRTVRIWAPSVTQKRITATLVSTNASSITLAPHRTPGDTLELDLESVRIVEVAEGKRSNMLLGAIAGIGAGALIGLAVGQLNKDNPDSPRNDWGRLALGIGVGVGFVAGTIVGIASESEVWKRIPPARLRPGESGTEIPGLGFSLTVDW